MDDRTAREAQDARTSASDGPEDRANRTSVDAIVTLHVDTHPIEVTACDVSETGLKIETDLPLQRGPITVKMIGLPIFSGEVRWAGRRHAGIRFLERIPVNFLKEWVKAHGSSRR